jgi:DNA-binding MarR family transcriptional regulator
MTTGVRRSAIPLGIADATMEFVLAFDAWMQKTAVSNAGESVARLRLLYDLHCNGPRKMADLAGSLGVTPRNVTALVDALEADHLVRREPHPTDRRITMIEITGGSAKVEQHFGALRGAIADVFAEIDSGDRDAFGRVLDAVRTRLGDGVPPSTRT